MRRSFKNAAFRGRWLKQPSPLGASWLLLLIIVLFADLAISDRVHAEAGYASELSTKLNQTGRTVSFPVPLVDQGRTLGEVLIQLRSDDTVAIERASLIETARPHVAQTIAGALEMLPDNGGFVPIGAFADAGLPLRFDPGLQQLELALATDGRSQSELSLAGMHMPIVSQALAQPAFLSGYLNMIGGFDQVWDDEPSDDAGGRLELEGAVRAGNVVIENRALYEGDVDTSVCPDHARCTYGHVAGLKRDSTRLVYDVPEYQTRVTAGDTIGLGAGLQRPADLLGVSIEKNARKLAPGERITAAGSGSFHLDRSATVDVMVNGAVVQRLNLRPGNYNLRDLPLSAGANDVELAITTDEGERSTVRFNAYSDMSLLAAGKSEWAIGAGVPSYLIDSSRAYETGLTMATSYLRYGLTDDITGGLHLQGDDEVVMGGAGFALGTPWGLVGVDAGASAGDPGLGAAVDLKWSLVNFSAFTAGRTESLFASAEYRSTDFHRPGEVLGAADGILYPEFNYWLRLNASYSAAIFDDVTATLSARYQFADDEREVLGGYAVEGDRYGFDVTLSRPLSETTSASLLVGYSNELYGLDDELNQAIDPEFRVALRVNMRADDRTSVYGGYDTLGRESMLSAQRSEGNGAGRWDTSVDVSTRGRDERATAGVSAGYYGDRAEIRLSQYADADGFDVASPSFDRARHRTSLRVGTAIAFAGDKVAVGAPVRSEAFAIVTPHESLAGHDIITGSIDNVRARADGFGNGLVTDIPAYMPSSVPVDVEDLPLGYSLGAGAFDTFAPYRAGYVFEVGSASSVSVYGTLVDALGEPVSLVAGTARPDGAQGRPVSVFTNGAGRFGAEGLSPGRWIIEMPLESGPLHYLIDVPEGANGLVKVGTLSPAEGSAQ